MTKDLRRCIIMVGVPVALAWATTAQAAAPVCRPRCANVESVGLPTSIMPSPNDFSRSGELFSGNAVRQTIVANGAIAISLGFDFRIGSTVFRSVNVTENGALEFVSAIGAGAPAVAGSTFTPYIAPYAADLAQGSAGAVNAGGIYVQYGKFDPFADSATGQYDQGEAQTAVKIVWYGTTQTLASGASPQVYAEVILSGDDQGNNSFAFRWGQDTDRAAPTYLQQPDYGSRAGFAFYDQRATIAPSNGRYATGGTSSVFDVKDGMVVGIASTAVPEPTTWLSMLLGFALTGWALRRRSRSVTALAVR